MRRHKPDRPVTRMMIREGYFKSADSFVSLPDGDDNESHVFLKNQDWIEQKGRVWQRDKQVCALCGKHVDMVGIADPDHIVKRSKGGSDDMGNLRTVHRDCHNKRHPEKRLRFGESVNTLPAVESSEEGQI